MNKRIKYRALTILFFCLSGQIFAQEKLILSREQAEAVFLKENLLLIAERLEVPKAEAMVLQAKLWPNPTIELNETNLWVTRNQIEHAGAEGFLPPFTSGGRFGQNQQFGIQIEQLIQTAGKRKKLVALEQVSVDMSKQYLEDLLRNLKIEFRNQLTTLQYLQFSRSIYQNQFNSIRQLTQAYKRQVEQGNVPQGEYIRLKALELEIAKNINELNKDVDEAQKELKLLMRLPATTQLEITDEGYLKNTEQFKILALNDVIEQAKANRPDYKIAALEESYYNKLYALEKAQRTPDLNFIVNYDRGGNFIKDFVGFGVAMDLPFFNRNQGNIKSARIGIEQSKVLYEQMTLSVESEIVLSFQNLTNAITFLEEIEPDYETTLDRMLESYTKNFINRNISLLEYLDFLDAYLENKEIILEAGKDVNEKAEQLNFSIGTDLIK
ncbi:TolC family protein [Cecembia rubra]|uniref:Cobalt-zinc-cadmium efflux system outer membrane protein n=1 Tax=Cecembia rubra TaxID=1485585 RepID=A0A2P8DRH0_9BACT|nr:TolC family protein [Cecembia rubra]PSK99816.1 cobalt-zinc-cadmium efflux system outer membrane protein [Cecembia rubra]